MAITKHSILESEHSSWWGGLALSMRCALNAFNVNVAHSVHMRVSGTVVSVIPCDDPRR